ncbi:MULTISPECIES: Rrf2 family transcriptional regulator [unclassified Rhizobium]|nr:Rrf2 family transcriptional regulator [Rhizobium sp. 16-488-2b]MBO9177399.1 Rrf2 family transcriptional regulator [Rhizobium sp. 16-488-2a]
MSVLLDLGIRLLVLAAARAPDKVTIRETAASCAASHAHLAKAANRLVKGGFLCSLRGRRGGLKLCIAPRGDRPRRRGPVLAWFPAGVSCSR